MGTLSIIQLYSIIDLVCVRIRFATAKPENLNDEREYMKQEPKYLTKHNLWDSDWLRKKYPERFDVGAYCIKDIIFDKNGELWDVI